MTCVTHTHTHTHTHRHTQGPCAGATFDVPLVRVRRNQERCVARGEQDSIRSAAEEPWVNMCPWVIFWAVFTEADIKAERGSLSPPWISGMRCNIFLFMFFRGKTSFEPSTADGVFGFSKLSLLGSDFLCVGFLVSRVSRCLCVIVACVHFLCVCVCVCVCVRVHRLVSPSGSGCFPLIADQAD